MSAKANSIAAQLRVLASQLDGADVGTWDHGIAEFGPPDELDRVAWRFIEEDVLREFGPSIKVPELLVSGETVYHLVEIPRGVHFRCTFTTQFGKHNAANASFLAPFNCSRVYAPNVDPVILPGTFSAWDTADQLDVEILARKFWQRCVNLRDGNVQPVNVNGLLIGFSGVSSDPDPGPA